MDLYECDSTKTDIWWEPHFPCVCKTVQRLALCCSCGSCYTGMRVQGSVLQQSSLLVILTQLVTENPFKCPRWSNSSRIKARQTSILIPSLWFSSKFWKQNLLTCFVCRAGTVLSKSCLNVCMHVYSGPHHRMTELSLSWNIQSSRPIIRLPCWGPRLLHYSVVCWSMSPLIMKQACVRSAAWSKSPL